MVLQVMVFGREIGHIPLAKLVDQSCALLPLTSLDLVYGLSLDPR